MDKQTFDYVSLKPIADRFRKAAGQFLITKSEILLKIRLPKM